MKVATRTIVGDGLTPVRAYASLRAADPNGASFLLESVVGGERWGRFSIRGYRPKYEIVLDRSGWSVRGDGPSFTAAPDAKDPIVAASALFAPDAHGGDMATRFARSHVGYLAWDIVHVIDKVPPGSDDTSS
jgi:anthranilate synthase component 1